jgi:hypothetical protein
MTKVNTSTSKVSSVVGSLAKLGTGVGGTGSATRMAELRAKIDRVHREQAEEAQRVAAGTTAGGTAAGGTAAGGTAAGGTAAGDTAAGGTAAGGTGARKKAPKPIHPDDDSFGLMKIMMPSNFYKETGIISF